MRIPQLLHLMCSQCGYWAVVERGKVNSWTCPICGEKIYEKKPLEKVSSKTVTIK